MTLVTLQKIPLHTRIIDALTTFVLVLLFGLACVLMAPLVALATFFKSKEAVINIALARAAAPKPPIQPKPPTPDDGEAWKREHDEEYGPS